MRKSAATVIREVCDRHSMPYGLVLGQCKEQWVVRVRQEAMYETFVQCEHLSLPAIGRAFSFRDHTTILHGIKKHCEAIGITYENAKMMSGRDGRNGYPRLPAIAHLAPKYEAVMREARHAS